MSVAQSLLIDMTAVRYVDVSGMQYLCARLSERSSAGLTTRLALPALREVRDHLRNWRFPQAAADVAGTGGGFRSLVDPASYRYFGERQSEPEGTVRGEDPDLLPPHYFPIRTSFAVGGEPDPALADHETASGRPGTCCQS